MADPASTSPSQQSKVDARHKGDATPSPDRPPRPSRSAEGQPEGELSQDDPDHELRGEDQLVDGVSEVVQPDGAEEE